MVWFLTGIFDGASDWLIEMFMVLEMKEKKRKTAETTEGEANNELNFSLTQQISSDCYPASTEFTWRNFYKIRIFHECFCQK